MSSSHFLGTSKRLAVWSRPGKHLMVIGPTQTGKTTSVLAHVVRRATGPLVTTSTKNDFVDLPTLRPGSVYMLDLIKAVVVPKHVKPIRFSPMSLVHDWEDALIVARDLMRTAYSFEGTGVSEAGFWTRRASAVLAALLWAATVGRRPMGTVHAWATAQNADEPLQVLEATNDRTAASHTLRGIRNPSQQSAGVWSFAEQAVSLYTWTSAAERAANPNFDPDAFVRGQDTLHIVCPSTMTSEMGPSISIFVESLINAQYRHTNFGAIERPQLTLVLDELVNTAALPSLPSLLSEGAGQGVSAVIGTQDRAQVVARYGEHQARSIFSNCREKVLCGESSDVPMLHDIESLAGTTRLPETSKGYSGNVGEESRNVTEREVPTWSASSIAQLPEFRALYLRGAEPQLINLVHWRSVT